MGMLCAALGMAQPNFTANDQVLPYSSGFGFGANLNNYPPWTNAQVANVAAGNANLPGVGVNAFRSSLPEEFLETWGYNVRLADFQHYAQLGVSENLVFIGYPSAAHREPGMPCPGQQSAVFANLYEPIWDGGANGTPVNDQNYFALYLWKMVNIYKPYVRFWEVWNEPDFALDQTAANALPGQFGNWWDNDPDPCNNALFSPVEHYVRMLRISWEVIKTADPDAYVCVGGLGNPAFLDAVLRNSDNPADGSVTADYPLLGGAYFDVLSFHSYPHFDGSMWEFPPSGGLFFYRHSDRGVEGMVKRKQAMETVLAAYGYDGTDFPEKRWLLSETNIPRKAFNVYIGSDEAQRNYIIKALTEAHRLGFDQLHLFNVADLSSEADAWNEFLLMGLFKHLSDFTYPNYELTDGAAAWQTANQFLTNRNFDEALTAALSLPADVRGAAFRGQQDTLFVLWAPTSMDQSEAAAANFSFPAALGLDTLWQMAWDHATTSDTAIVTASSVALTASPVFLVKKPPYVQPPDDTMIVDQIGELFGELALRCFPNPAANGQFQVELELKQPATLSLHLSDMATGQRVAVLQAPTALGVGRTVLSFRPGVPAGIYLLEVKKQGGGTAYQRVVFTE